MRGANMRKYKQLTRDQRYTIKALLQESYSQIYIAKRIGVHRSTVCREVKRNKQVKEPYYAGIADNLARKRKKVCRKPVKLTDSVQRILIPYIKDDWSPEQIAGRLKITGELMISHETIYKFISQDKTNGGQLYKHLRGKHKYRKKYGSYSRFKQRHKKSISSRPKAADNRERVGDWEIDTVVSKKSKDVLVTIVDRKTRFTLMRKCRNRTTREVMEASRLCFVNNKAIVHTITADNGLEFSGFKKLENWFNLDFFFAHPYSSWERGTNENTNGLIRQYFPKGASFKRVWSTDVKRVQDKLNNRPRKTLGFKTPKECYEKEACCT